jgi:hypothetical protein
MPEVIVPESAARIMVAGAVKNAHLICYDGEVRVTSRRSWLNFYQRHGGRLIITRDDLAAIDPAAFGYPPATLAELLSDYASNLDPA